jgi:hypothetical protein
MNILGLCMSVFFTLSCLTGCSTAALPGLALAPDVNEGFSVTAVIVQPMQHLQMLNSAFSVSNIDHVNLQVLRDGNTVSGVSRSIARAALGRAVTLSNLRLATAYQIQATAFADAAETNQISVDAKSITPVFVAPSVMRMASGDTTDQTPLAITVPLVLGFKVGTSSYTASSTLTFAGQVTFTINADTRNIDHVNVSLYNDGMVVILQGGLTSMEYPVSKQPYVRTLTLSQIKMDGNYLIQVQAYKSNGKPTGLKQTVTFNTMQQGGAYEDRPALSATSITI